MSCYWRATTTRGRILTFDRHSDAPQTFGASYPSCVANQFQRQAGYPGPLTSDGGNYSIWCLHNDESIISTESYDCQGVDLNRSCDCINGACVPKETYNTPGKFSNLANCQSACAKDSTCTGECVSSEQIAALQQAASNIRSRLCK